MIIIILFGYNVDNLTDYTHMYICLRSTLHRYLGITCRLTLIYLPLHTRRYRKNAVVRRNHSVANDSFALSITRLYPTLL